MATLKCCTQVGGGASTCMRVTGNAGSVVLGTGVNPFNQCGIAIGRRTQQYGNNVSPNISIGYKTQMSIYPGGGTAASCLNIGIGNRANYDLRCCAGGTSCGLCNIAIGTYAGFQHFTSCGMIALGRSANFAGGRRANTISIGALAHRGYSTTGQRHINIGYGTYFIACCGATDTINIGHKVNRYGSQCRIKSIVIGFCASTNANNCVVRIGAKGGTGGNCTTAIGYNTSGGYGLTNNKISISVNCNPWYAAGHTLLGNSYHDTAYVIPKWSVLSDYRDKANICYLGRESGLNFVNQLNPITFNWDKRDLYELKCGYEFGQKDGTLSGETEHYGFLAQEIYDTIQQNNLDLEIISRDLKHYRLNHTDLIPSITLSLQELVENLEDYETRVETLKNS